MGVLLRPVAQPTWDERDFDLRKNNVGIYKLIGGEVSIHPTAKAVGILDTFL